MNMNDGSVFIDVEGTSEQLNRFITWCKTGPAHADVADINIQEGNIKGYTEFKIRY